MQRRALLPFHLENNFTSVNLNQILVCSGDDIESNSSRLTDERLTVLSDFKKMHGSSLIFLWLNCALDGERCMLLSYQVGLAEEEIRDAKNAMFRIPNGLEQCLAKSVAKTQILVPPRLSDSKTTLKAFPLLRNAAGLPSKLGIVVMDVPGQVDDSFQAELEKFALRIELGRAERIVRSVSRAHKILRDSSDGVDSSLKELASVVSEDIGALGVLYRNTNSHSSWLEIDGSQGRPVDLSYVQERGNCGAHSICRATATLRRPNEDEVHHNCTVVPLLQDGFKIEGTPIRDSDETIELMKSKQINDISLAFFEKSVSGYLQNRFSDTDMTILQSVFGFVDEFASAGIFQENYAKVASYLKTNNFDDDLDLASVHELLASLSISFSDLFIVSAENVGESITLSVSAISGGTLPDDHYLKRLKDTYLQTYFANKSDDEDEAMRIGFDVNQGPQTLEIHLPGMSGSTNIFLLVYQDEMMSLSVFRSILLLFRELHVRLQKNENTSNRANYMMQVRHAVVHHFAAAHKSMATMRKVWGRAQRNQSAWVDLLTDPIFPTIVTRAHWSLAQAQLVLENGRFLIKDINAGDLDKKPYKILDLIQDCLNTLQDQRLNKDLTVYARPIGSAPSIMNGDATLLRIAMMNLIDNAFKYSPNGKTVSWKVEFLADRYRFEISSGGIQLDPENRNHLFRIGVRGKQADRLNPRQGTGLGLPIAHKILLAHSEIAELDFTSVPFDPTVEGPLNTFFFEMPYLTGTSKT